MSSLAARARRHWLFLVVVVGGVVLRTLAAVAYRPALFYADSYKYLGNVGEFDPTMIWPAGYSLVLTGLLAAGDLLLIPIVQHLLGIGIAVALYVLLLRWEVPRWVAAIATVPVLLDAYQVQSEQNVMPETIFQVLLVAGLGILALRRRPTWWHAGFAGLLLGLAVPVRLVGMVLFIPALLVVLVTQRSWLRRLTHGLALVVAFAIPVAGYASWYAVQDDQFQLSPDWITPHMLYARVARFVDCDELDVPAEQRGLCPSPQQQANMVTDDFSWRTDSPIWRYTAPPGEDKYDVVAEFAERAIAGQPLDFAYWVTRDTVKAFAPRKETFQFDKPVERWRFQTEFPVWPPGPDVPIEEHGGGPLVVVEPLASALRSYQVTAGYVPPILLGLAGLAGLAGGVVGWRRDRRGVAVQCWAWSLAGFMLVVLPAAYQFSWRYQIPTFVLFPTSAAFAVVALRDRKLDTPMDAVDRDALDAFFSRHPDLHLPPLVVVIAAYDEEHAVGGVLDEIPDQVCGLQTETIVVADGCTDATAEVARDHGALVCDVPVNRGQGAALRLGYRIARDAGARYIATLDADGQYHPSDLETVVEPLVADRADFVTGSRRLGREQTRSTFRKAGVRVFAWLATVLSGQRITDTSNGLRAMRAEVTEDVRLTQPQYQASELLMGTLAHGYRVVEVPTTMRERTAGASKKGNDVLYGMRYARVLVGTWLRERSSS